MNNVFHNFFIPVFVAYIVVFLVVEFLGHRKCIYSPLLHTAKWFSKLVVPIYTPRCSAQELTPSISSPILGGARLSNYTHFCGCVMVYHSPFNLYFLSHLCKCLLAICTFSFGKCLSKYLALLNVRLTVCFPLIQKSSTYSGYKNFLPPS